MRSSSIARPSASSRLHLQHRDRRLHDIAKHRHVREQIEALEHHADIAADLVQVALAGRERTASLRLVVADAGQFEAPLLERLERHQYAKNRGFPGARRPDQRHLLALADIEVEAVQNREGAEPFDDVFEADDGCHRRGIPLLGRARSSQVDHGRADEGHGKEDEADQGERHEIIEGALADHVGKAEHVEHRHHREDRRFLQHGDEIVAESRDDPRDHLRARRCPYRSGAGRGSAPSRPPTGRAGPHRCRRDRPPTCRPNIAGRAPARRS